MGRSKNVFYLHSDGYYVGITRQGVEFKFDIEDFAKVKQYTWCLSKSINYIVTCDYKNNSRILLLHRVALDLLKEKDIVDHINHDTLDNRKGNLRRCNHHENNANQRISIRNKSGFKGVSFCSLTKKWRANIQVKGKSLNLGRYNTKEEAALAYNKAASFYFGDFASLNVV